jgi:hypothetical protein
MPEVPVEPGRRDWLSEDEVSRRWGVRRSLLKRVADLADVAYHVSRGTLRGRGVYGAEPSFTSFSPQDVERAGRELKEGRLVLDPSWLTDTPQGQQAERKERRDGWLVELIFFLPVLLVGAFALYAIVDTLLDR